MHLSCDRLGFPLLQWSDAGLDIALFPVLKIQFERFLATPNAFGDTWYEQVLAVNPRTSWRRFGPEEREQLFLTGLLPSEALAFAHWLDSEFDVPTVEEWRAIDRFLMKSTLDACALEALRCCPMSPAARAIVEGLRFQTQPQRWGELALLRGGVFEWVRQGAQFVGLGAPRPRFFPNTFHPQRDDPVRPLHAQRLPYFGVRLVRRLSTRATDAEDT